MNEEKKSIEIVTGDGSNLDISGVSEHINPGKPKCTDDKPKNIVIPKVNKNSSNNGSKNSNVSNDNENS